ncbi:WG repeat-containing protein [Olleya marilimosa]|uniref:WG repeat-containing protein n=1 Tax=Olleya marilimosa TaxID=272164 RepID=A0ABR8LWZ9_9FLAO|nr:WG repeat-containing protein [Olleya marilimosa]MBD3864694.1 WG repeat-containing protein [Olleya marilimosa]
MNKTFFLIFISVLNFYSCNSQDSKNYLFPIKDGSLHGLIDINGNFVCEPKFSEIGEFKEDLAYVTNTSNGFKAGYIDKNGELIVEPSFQPNRNISRQFSEGFAVVKIKNKYGYINKKGEITIQPKYINAQKFNEGFAAVQLTNGNKVLIDKKGEIVLDAKKILHDEFGLKIERGEFVSINDYVKDNAISFEIKKHNYPFKMGVFNSKGKQLFKLKDLRIYEYNNGIALARTSDYKKAGYINKKGEVIIPFKFIKASNFHNGYAKVQDETSKKFGIINEQGKYTVKPNFISISEKFHSNNLILVQNTNKKYGYVNFEGNVIIDFIYDHAHDFSEGLAMVYDRIMKRRFYINEKGEKVIELDFDTSNQSESGFKNGLAKVKLKEVGLVYINKKGKVIYKFKK